MNDVHSITSAYDRQDSRSPVRCGRSPSRHYTDDLNEYRGHRPGRHGCGDRKLKCWYDGPGRHRRRRARTGGVALSRSAHGRDNSTGRKKRCADCADFDGRRRNFTGWVGHDSVMLSGEESAADGRCAVVEPSKHLHPYLQRSAPTLRGIARRSNLETIVPSLQPVRAELIEEAKAPASPQSTQLPVARVLRPQTAAERSTLTTDGTIDGGVKSPIRQ